MRRRKVLNRYSNCYEGDCQFCHDVSCMVEQGYQKPEYERFTPADYKDNITSLAGLLFNEGADGLIKHFGTLNDLNDKELTYWAIENCGDETLLAEFAKHMPYHWKTTPYSSEIAFLLSKIKDEAMLEGLVSWADSTAGEEKLSFRASERLDELRDGESSLADETEEEYDEYDDEEPEATAILEMSPEELFAVAKNYMEAVKAEKAVYRLAELSERNLLAELAKGDW